MSKTRKNEKEFERSSVDYFKDIANFKPLLKEEEKSLWERYKKNNDINARDKIIKSNLRFVHSVAKDYLGMGLSYEDLVAEGSVGFMKAIEKFDYKRDFKTISYSVWWIRQTILEALKKRNSLKFDELPNSIKNDYDENCDTDYVISEFETDDYIDKSDFSNMKENEIAKVSSMLLNCLNERERYIITKYFGLGDNEEMTLDEIGAHFGLTKERIRQIKEGALLKLRSEALKNSITSEIYN